MKQVISIEKFHDTKTSVDTDDKLPDDITLQYLLILMTFVIKDDDSFIHNYY